ncbi:hypothetical protein OKW38_003745 [Paraburkholderia sp. MM5496-R1]|uniref:hypothetical protein n=1 Tax=Paraburkholderia sp. MM5496-R1 TaxID=2991065 RepID=UPI003D1FB020
MNCIATAVPYPDTIAAFGNSDVTEDVPVAARHLGYISIQLSRAQVRAWEIQERDRLSVVQFLDLEESMATAPDNEIEPAVSAFAVASALVSDDAEEREHAYKHIPLKAAFSVQATYKHVGRLKPRKFSFDE